MDANSPTSNFEMPASHALAAFKEVGSGNVRKSHIVSRMAKLVRDENPQSCHLKCGSAACIGQWKMHAGKGVATSSAMAGTRAHFSRITISITGVYIYGGSLKSLQLRRGHDLDSIVILVNTRCPAQWPYHSTSVARAMRLAIQPELKSACIHVHLHGQNLA